MGTGAMHADPVKHPEDPGRAAAVGIEILGWQRIWRRRVGEVDLERQRDKRVEQRQEKIRQTSQARPSTAGGRQASSGHESGSGMEVEECDDDQQNRRQFGRNCPDLFSVKWNAMPLLFGKNINYSFTQFASALTRP
jgi:hypothetical protein